MRSRPARSLGAEHRKTPGTPPAGSPAAPARGRSGYRPWRFLQFRACNPFRAKFPESSPALRKCPEFTAKRELRLLRNGRTELSFRSFFSRPERETGRQFIAQGSVHRLFQIWPPSASSSACAQYRTAVGRARERSGRICPADGTERQGEASTLRDTSPWGTVTRLLQL